MALNTHFFFFLNAVFLFSFSILKIQLCFSLASIVTVKVLFHSFAISFYAFGLSLSVFNFLPVFKIVSLSLFSLDYCDEFRFGGRGLFYGYSSVCGFILKYSKV